MGRYVTSALTACINQFLGSCLTFRLADIMTAEPSVLKMLLLLYCWIIEGTTAEESPKSHYLVKNSSFCLSIDRNSISVDLTFHNKRIFMNSHGPAEYKHRVHYNASEGSLCVNQLTETDSGTYSLDVVQEDYTSLKKSHTLHVQEAVPTPVIRMSTMHPNVSAQLCNITVNCSVLDDWLVSVCGENSCRTSQESLTKVNISVSAGLRSVVCSGSNRVSTSSVSESTESMCLNNLGNEQDASETLALTIMMLSIAPILAVCVIISIIYKATRHVSTKHNDQEAQTRSARTHQPAEAQPPPPFRVSISSSHSEVSYENMDVTLSEPNHAVNTIYGTAGVPKVAAPAGEHEGGKGRNSHTQLPETRNPPQVDTVYTVLQKIRTDNDTST